MPIGLLPKKRKVVANPNDGMTQIRTIEGPMATESQTALVEGLSTL